MPITIKTGTLKYKKSNGEYDGFNAIAQESTDQQITDIQAAGTAQVGAVTAKGQEVLESIPEDYTELSGNVADIKSALTDIDHDINGNDGICGIPKPYTIGANNKWTAETTSSHVCIPVQSGDTITLKAASKTAVYAFLVSDNARDSVTADFAPSETGRYTLAANTSISVVVPSGTKYLYLTVTANSTSGNYPASILINGIERTNNIRIDVVNTKAAIADDFSASKNYPANAIVRYAGELYKFKIRHAAGEWTGSDAEKTTVADALTDAFSRYYNGGVLINGTDFNDLKSPMYAILGASHQYIHAPSFALGRGVVFVFTQTPAASGNVAQVSQIIYSTQYGELHSRYYTSAGGWSNWVTIKDELAMVLGANEHRKALDHGGFWENQLYEDSPKAFLDAAKAGIKYHNVDIIFSSDDVPFVYHNLTGTDASGNTFSPESKTAAELKAITLGDANYTWTMMTLAEADAYIKSLGGIIDMVDISATAGIKALRNAGQLPAYYRANNIKPTWTNTDRDNYRDAFIAAGPKYGVYMIISSLDDVSTVLSYIQNNPNVKFAVNVMTVNANVRTAFESQLSAFAEAGVVMYAYQFNGTTDAGMPSQVPGWADGALSERLNINYEQYKAVINA